MGWVSVIALVIGLAACGPPVARNIPQPNTGAAAGIAAGAAAALTVADPASAAKRQEEKKVVKEPREQKVKATVPSDVLDRLDQQQAHDVNRDSPLVAPTPAQ